MYSQPLLWTRPNHLSLAFPAFIFITSNMRRSYHVLIPTVFPSRSLFHWTSQHELVSRHRFVHLSFERCWYPFTTHPNTDAPNTLYSSHPSTFKRSTDLQIFQVWAFRRRLTWQTGSILFFLFVPPQPKIPKCVGQCFGEYSSQQPVRGEPQHFAGALLDE